MSGTDTVLSPRVVRAAHSVMLAAHQDGLQSASLATSVKPDSVLQVEREYEQYLLMSGLSAKTKYVYRAAFTSFLQFAEIQSLQDITPNSLRVFAKCDRDRGMSSATVKVRIASITKFMKSLSDRKIIEISVENINQTIHEIFGDIKQYAPKYVEEWRIIEFRRFIASYQPNIQQVANKRERIVALVDLLFDTGLQIHDLCALRVDDFSRPRSTVDVFGPTGRRVLPLSHRTMESLKKYWDGRLEVFGSSIWAFTGRESKNALSRPISPRTVEHILLNASQECFEYEKDYVSASTFRHYLVWKMIEDRRSDVQIADRLGYENPYSISLFRRVLGAEKWPTTKKLNGS